MLDLIGKEYQSELAEDIQEALKDLILYLLKEILNAKLNEHLDYFQY